MYQGLLVNSLSRVRAIGHCTWLNQLEKSDVNHVSKYLYLLFTVTSFFIIYTHAGDGN